MIEALSVGSNLTVYSSEPPRGTWLGLPLKFRSQKIPRNSLETVFIIPRNKVLIPCDSEHFGRVHSVTGEKMEFREILEFNEAANKSRIFPKFFLLPEIIWNGIPKFFLFQKWFGMEFQGFFSSENGSERNSKVFLIQKWFGMEFRGFFSSEKWFGMEFQGLFSSEKWFGTEFRGFFSSEKWFGTEFRGFSIPRNRRNSDGTAVCSVVFRIPRNNFFVGKWQP